MHRLLPLLLLAVACSEPAGSEVAIEVASDGSVALRAARGDVVVRNGDQARLVVRGTPENIDVETRDGTVVLRSTAEGESQEFELFVPAGVSVDIVLRDGAVSVEGAFGAVTATVTSGSIDAGLDACRGADLRNRAGDVTLRLRERKPEADVRAETIDGNASVEIPGGFRGPVQMRSDSAQLDFGADPKVGLLVAADRKSARGFAGTPMSEEERTEAAKTNRWPAGVWVTTKKGVARFRVN